MKGLLKLLISIPAIAFVVMGVAWIAAPARIAPQFGLSLSEGLGLSSQIGDMSGYFLTLGFCMLIAVLTGKRSWFYPPMLLLSITALGRTLAWILHDASLAVEPIALELSVSTLLLLGAVFLASSNNTADIEEDSDGTERV